MCRNISFGLFRVHPISLYRFFQLFFLFNFFQKFRVLTFLFDFIPLTNMLFSIFFILFLVFSAIHVIGELIYEQKEPNPIRLPTKPFLMPFLILYYIFALEGTQINQWIVAGVLFGWIGDVALIYAKKSRKAFLLGIVAFLIGHIWYIIAFLTEISSIGAIPLYIYLIIVPLALFGVVIFNRLKNSLGKMKIPVIAYIIIILFMLWSAIALSSSKECVQCQISDIILLISGALLFVISDTLNAWEKFKQPIPYNRAVIMITYLLAQWFIVESFLGINGIL